MCLDVVSIPVVGYVDADPERCLVDESLRWEYMGPVGPAEWPTVMRRVQTAGLTLDERPASEARRCLHTLVQPQDPVFHVRLVGAPLAEVSFSLGEQSVCLPVWDVHLIQQLVAVGDGDYPGEVLGFESGCILLTVDLGVSHQSRSAVVGCFAVPFQHRAIRGGFARLSLLPTDDVVLEEEDPEEWEAFLQWAEEEALTQEALEAGEEPDEDTLAGEGEESDWDGYCPECGEFICIPFVADSQDFWTCDMCGTDVSSSGEVLLWDEESEDDDSEWDGSCPDCDARICDPSDTDSQNVWMCDSCEARVSSEGEVLPWDGCCPVCGEHLVSPDDCESDEVVECHSCGAFVTAEGRSLQLMDTDGNAVTHDAEPLDVVSTFEGWTETLLARGHTPEEVDDFSDRAEYLRIHRPAE